MSLLNLTDLLAAARLRDLKDDKLFYNVFASGVSLFDLTDREIASELDIGTSAVKQWRDGRGVPVGSMRLEVFLYMEHLAAAKLRVNG